MLPTYLNNRHVCVVMFSIQLSLQGLQPWHWSRNLELSQHPINYEMKYGPLKKQPDVYVVTVVILP